MKRLLGLLTLSITAFAFPVFPQACGWVHERFVVKDTRGSAIPGVKFDFLSNEDGKLMFEGEQHIKREEDGTYFLREGMCGGHRDVRIKISARGFDIIEGVFNLPLSRFTEPDIFRVQLRKLGTHEDSYFEKVGKPTN